MKQRAVKPTETYCPKSRQQWRAWLRRHHAKKESVWLIYYKKSSGMTGISWSEAVDEALCFGWIDSRKKLVDEKTFMQFFCPRKTKSTWSAINKEKVRQLISEKRMAKAGYESIETAKQNGSWELLNKAEALEIPADLEKELLETNGMNFFLCMSRSVQKAILQWLVLARRNETRAKRIHEIAACSAEGEKPKAFR